MTSETINLLGYTLITLVLVSATGYLIYQKVSDVSQNDNFKLVYAASDLALFLDAIYASPQDVNYYYSLNVTGVDYKITPGMIVIKKYNSTGPYAKKAYHRFGYSNITEMDNYVLSFSNESVSFFILKKAKEIIIVNTTSSDGVDFSTKSCPTVVLTNDGGSSAIMLDFPIIPNMNDPNKDAAVAAKNILDLMGTSYDVLHNSMTSTMSFDEVVTHSNGKKFYLYITKKTGTSGINLIFKEQKQEYDKFYCVLNNLFSSVSSVKTSYGFTGEYQRFNDIKAEYVVVLEFGDDVGKSISYTSLSKIINDALFGFFK
ncbi:MAG: hypothetical protein WC755_03385 [Candidatus Woesearchaeota archaeon]|jgi:hypothetical protein